MIRGEGSDVERRLERLESDIEGAADSPEAGLITIIATAHNGGKVKWVDRERRLALIDGERYHIMDEWLTELQTEAAYNQNQHWDGEDQDEGTQS